MRVAKLDAPQRATKKASGQSVQALPEFLFEYLQLPQNRTSKHEPFEFLKDRVADYVSRAKAAGLGMFVSSGIADIRLLIEKDFVDEIVRVRLNIIYGVVDRNFLAAVHGSSYSRFLFDRYLYNRLMEARVFGRQLHTIFVLVLSAVTWAEFGQIFDSIKLLDKFYKDYKRIYRG